MGKKGWGKSRDFALDKFQFFCNTPGPILTGAGAPLRPVLVFVAFLSAHWRVMLMIVRIAKALSTFMVVVCVAGVRPAICEAASLLSPVTSAVSKVTTGTKNLLTKTGQAVGLVKTPAVKKSKWPAGKMPPPKNWNKG
jgi:hypothetical protein